MVVNINGYELVSSENLDEIRSEGYVFRHIKSGARVVVVSNEDDNKVFSIAFRTPPNDSTGVPHIIEHSVLCGSRKYPAKDSFVELCKGSLNTFLNAMTYPDKTVYPIASCNDKDFQNLMSVYLDAVFYPNIYSKKEIFMQEGWHYELDSKDAEIQYNGVVYNEMKGAFSSPEQILYRGIQHSLFPDTSYGTESGGDPECIPNLTYEEFLDFHSKYYHPCNSYIYLYGDMNIEEKLTWLDNEYLNNFEKIDIDSAIRKQEPFESIRTCVMPYPITEDESEQDNAYLSYNIVIGTSLEKELTLAFEVLDYVLLGSSGAPLKQALIDAGLAKDILGGYDADIYQPFFSIIAKNSNLDKKEEFVNVIMETLQRICNEGVDEKALRAAINRYEFKHREADYERYPKGLVYGLDMLNTWLYDDNAPFLCMSVNDTYKFLKEQIGTGYYERLIKQYLIDNTHGTFVAIEPHRGLTKKMDQLTADKLRNFKASLTDEQLEQLIADTIRLREYQDEKSTPEQLDTIPMLEIGDIKKTTLEVINEVRIVGNTTLVYQDIYTNGIGYFDFVFDLDKVPKTIIPYVGLFSIALGYFNTENYSYTEIDNEINMVTGGVETNPTVITRNYNGKVKSYMKVSGRTLYENVGRTFELIYEILFRSNYRDKKRFKELVQQTRSRMDMKMNSSGHVAAAKRAMSYISEKSMFNELTGNIAFYEFIKDLDDNFEQKFEQSAIVFERLTKMIFVKENLLINFTADSEGYGVFEGFFEQFIKALPTPAEIDMSPIGDFDMTIPNEYATVDSYILKKKNEGIKTAGKIQYVARAGNFYAEGMEYTGTLSVLRMILSYDYLWTNVREKGGAYGVMCSFLRDGLGYFTSYRDPNLEQTIKNYEGAVDYIRNFDADDKNMTKYIIGTISGMDTPLSPYARGQRELSIFLTGMTYDLLQKERNEVLGTTAEDIRALAGRIEKILSDDNLCVIGNENKIEECKDMFFEVKKLK